MKQLIMAALCFTFFALCPQSKADIITFDDITTSPFPDRLIPEGYRTFTWHNIGYTNADLFPFDSGIRTGVVSWPYIGGTYTGNGAVAFFSRETPFSIMSMFVTAKDRSTTPVTFIGFRGNDVIYRLDTEITRRPTVFLTLDWYDITKLQIISDADPISFDNIFVLPEPSTYVMLAVGLWLIAGAAYRWRGMRT